MTWLPTVMCFYTEDVAFKQAQNLGPLFGNEDENVKIIDGDQTTRKLEPVSRQPLPCRWTRCLPMPVKMPSLRHCRHRAGCLQKRVRTHEVGQSHEAPRSAWQRLAPIGFLRTCGISLIGSSDSALASITPMGNDFARPATSTQIACSPAALLRPLTATGSMGVAVSHVSTGSLRQGAEAFWSRRICSR
jgi:hypothetical protein